jgi:predicted dithiol-disulfide oxidoreductase (DUF899 family)
MLVGPADQFLADRGSAIESVLPKCDAVKPRRRVDWWHFWGAELGFESADPGKDPATEPDLMVLWNVLDWTPEGRGTDWYPKITY